MTEAMQNTLTPTLGEATEIGRGGMRTNRPLRIAFCISRTFERFQGTYGRYAGQARLLRDLGHEVTVFGVNREMKQPENEIHFGVGVHRVPVRSKGWGGPRNFFNFRKMHAALMERLRSGYSVPGTHPIGAHFDAVKIIGQDLSPMIPMIQKELKIPVIFDAHEPLIYGFWTGPRRALLPVIYGIEKRNAAKADAVHITGNFQKRRYEACGCRNVAIVGNQPLWDERIEVFPEGKFDDAKRGGPVIFGRLGTVYKGTGLHELLEAFAVVYRKYPERARLRLAGKVAEYYEEEFARTVAPYKEGLILSGAYATTDMPRLYGEIHVSVLPYLMDANFTHINPSKFYDSIGNATAVAMTPIGDMGEILARVKCGRTIDPERIESITEAMEFYLEHPESLEREARAGFAASLGEFSWRENQRVLEEGFQKVVG